MYQVIHPREIPFHKASSLVLRGQMKMVLPQVSLQVTIYDVVAVRFHTVDYTFNGVSSLIHNL
jgi:hypothetical protein